MKRIILVLTLIFTAFFAQSQDSWKIKLNKKVVVSADAENETKNTVQAKWKDLQSGKLEVLYKSLNPPGDWIRSLIFVDENDNELLRKDSIGSVASFNNSALKKLFTGKKKIKIYTIALPADPALAATVRVRRVHLLTIDLK